MPCKTGTAANFLLISEVDVGIEPDGDALLAGVRSELWSEALTDNFGFPCAGELP